jgi:flavin-binding protein dodecin
MSDHTYKLIELVGVSEHDVSDAVRSAVRRAAATLRGLDWFQVSEIRGTIRDGDVHEFQVTVKVGFRVMSGEELANG